jgi:hypothetical protein
MPEPAAAEKPDTVSRQGVRNADWALRQVEEALRGLQFGQVTLTVQDGVVVQLERTERRRFQRGGRTT